MEVGILTIFEDICHLKSFGLDSWIRFVVGYEAVEAPCQVLMLLSTMMHLFF